MHQEYNLWTTALVLEWALAEFWSLHPIPTSLFFREYQWWRDPHWTKNEYLLWSGYKICEHDSGKVSPMERSSIERVLERPLSPPGSWVTKSKLRAAEWVPGEIPGSISALWKHPQGFTFPPQIWKLSLRLEYFQYVTVKILPPVPL